MLATTDDPDGIDAALARYRTSLAQASDRSVPRDACPPLADARPAPDEVEDARSIVRRFVVSAMSVGALSPEAHQALTIGIQRAGGAANTGEGGEDPAWYVPGDDGRRRDARIKQVASARVRRHRRISRRVVTRSRSPRDRSPARAARPFAARRPPTSPRSGAGRPARATSARRRTTTSTRSRTSPN